MRQRGDALRLATADAVANKIEKSNLPRGGAEIGQKGSALDRPGVEPAEIQDRQAAGWLAGSFHAFSVHNNMNTNLWMYIKKPDRTDRQCRSAVAAIGGGRVVAATHTPSELAIATRIGLHLVSGLYSDS